MSDQKNIHETFLEQSKTPENREELALKLLKTPGEINSLTAYHDFMRIESINKYLAKIYIVAGIRGVSHLREMSISQVEKKINDSPIGKTVRVEKELISQTIAQAKVTKIVVTGLEKEKFFLQRKGYIVSKSPSGQETPTRQRKSNRDIFLFTVIILVFIVFGFISLYFLALIPVVFALHIILETRCVSYLTYAIAKRGVPLLWKNFIGVSILSLFSSIFAIGFFTGSINASVKNTAQNMSIYQSNTPGDYFPKEVHDYYQNKEMTREDLIKILIVSTGVDISTQEEIECFKDSFQSKYPKEICYAKQVGYIQGDIHNFYPNRAISHAAGLKFILNFYGYGVPKRSLYLTYSDLQKTQWQTTYAEYAKRLGLIEHSTTKFYPDKNITIEQVDRYISVFSRRKK